ncbi:MutG family lantibiotic protection ABC superfamily ATP binding cassette transporter permease [Sporosarcina newyorkensis 2681]|uniref:MutG family lantibiotic protection ABC superfamily ATP binding cassette transporter permease n=1 Tax=Sporosarcina newyorkensis 2681 TaxID=1027292 RepID=F9DR75_9BACL|nr:MULTISPECIES: hypothetical protein [Sporosarcina]EGQ26618.1 MutG family lantibiotic protection ABC superfamily ATP binding cassette transporter permease [Sporosarcina newyorkensis 2681]MBY0221101.1 hypothetical protein [Sporosarcina aquimarina]
MYSNYGYWRSIVYPDRLAVELGQGTVTGFKRRVFGVFIFGIILFVLRDMWGMNTETMTYILANGTLDDYTIARYAALIGSVIWSVIYMSFHFWGVAWILSKVTNIPFKPLLKLQLVVTGLLVFEKAILFIVFALAGKTASISIFSFGPLAMKFLENWYIIYFVNQLTIFTALIVAVQYRFIRFYEGDEIRKDVLWLLIAIQIAFALITAAVGFIPVEKLLNLLMIGGL